MTNQIFIETVNNIPTFKKRFEIVERKGIGHPDTICDLVMNQISIDLSYVSTFTPKINEIIPQDLRSTLFIF